MKYNHGLIVFLLVYKRLNHCPDIKDVLEIDEKTKKHWIESALHACEMTYDELDEAGGFYRLAAEYYLNRDAYLKHCEEEQRDYDSIYN